MKKLFIIPALAFAVAFSSCGGGESSSDNADNQSTEVIEETESTTETVPGAEDLEIDNTIVLEGNDQMQFDKDLFRVESGEEITLTLKNVGELPKESMGHNVVVLVPGTDIASFGADATGAKDNDYIPEDADDVIVAHTDLLGPGEETTITFTIDEPGVYPFLCSFPGHFGSMKGEIVAE
ncbi:MAG TPA: azurin [Sphingobacterium sp.]|nr:azurin [Sphingobacterium sp.]